MGIPADSTCFLYNSWNGLVGDMGTFSLTIKGRHFLFSQCTSR